MPECPAFQFRSLECRLCGIQTAADSARSGIQIADLLCEASFRSGIHKYLPDRQAGIPAKNVPVGRQAGMTLGF